MLNNDTYIEIILVVCPIHEKKANSHAFYAKLYLNINVSK